MKNKWKVLLLLAIILIIIAVVVIVNKTKQNLIYNEEVEYNYFAMYSSDGKVGVVNKKGEIVLEPKYIDVFIPNNSKDVFFAYSDATNYEILNSKCEKLFEKYNNVMYIQTTESDLDFEKNFLTYEKDGKFGVINLDGENIVSADYDSIESLEYKPGELLVKKDDKYGVIDNQGKIKVDIKYDSITGDEYFTEKNKYNSTGYIVGTLKTNGYEYGYLDSNAKTILDVNFESISRVLEYDDNNIFLIVMSNGKKGVYKNNKEIIDLNYQNINYNELSNIFIAKRNSKYGIFSLNGDEVLPVKYISYSLAGDYIYVEDSDSKKKLYDVNGNEISNMNYKSVQASGDSSVYIVIDEDNKYSLITSDGINSDKYSYITYAYDNYFIVKNDSNMYGVLDLYNGLAIDYIYSSIIKIDGINGIEAKTSDNTLDIYSKKLNKVASIKNGILENLNNNYCRVYSDTELVYINRDGDITSNKTVYKDNKIYAFSENGKWGYKDSKDNVIVEPQYDFATDLNEYGFAGIYLQGKWGVVNSKGEIVIDTTLNIDTYYLPSFVGKYLLELTETYHCLECEE